MLLKLQEGTKLCDYLIPVIPGKEEIGIEEYSFSQSTLEQVLSTFHICFFHELVLGSEMVWASRKYNKPSENNTCKIWARERSLSPSPARFSYKFLLHDRLLFWNLEQAIVS